MFRINYSVAALLFFALCGGIPRGAGAQDTVLRDSNGDGSVSVLAFGDSITYGIGDGYPVGAPVETIPDGQPKAGFPSRVEELAGVSVQNSGVPGEEFVASGSSRFPSTVGISQADVVTFLEGSNDAVFKVSATVYRNRLQRVVNTARAFGKEIVLLTIPPTCCNRAGRNPIIAAFNDQIRKLALLNDVPVADIYQAFETTCEDKAECELLNKPEGLHPNTSGYSVVAENVLAALYGIDLFAPNGAADLAAALGISSTDIRTKPILSNP